MPDVNESRFGCRGDGAGEHWMPGDVEADVMAVRRLRRAVHRGASAVVDDRPATPRIATDDVRAVRTVVTTDVVSIDLCKNVYKK